MSPKQYRQMVAVWRGIAQQSLPDSEKHAACLAVFRRCLGEIALSHFGKANASLRFYLDMVQLREYLNPMFAHDDFGRLVIAPMWSLVSNWVKAHVDSRAGRLGYDEPLALAPISPKT